MAGKSELERIERLETMYVFSQEAFGKIEGHLAAQNGHLDDLREWQIQVKAVLRTLTVIATGSFAIAGIAVAVATGILR